MDAPSAQLHQDIRSAVIRELGHRRPLLHHLNADTSWLLQIPRPLAATRRGGRSYYNILIDPWFTGGQADVARWFSQQWHAIESKVRSIAQVEELAREVEVLASGLRLGKGRQPNGVETGSDVATLIDAVAVSHEFTDHCHKETLLQVHPDVPVFATEKAARDIGSWNHFRHVATVPAFTHEDPDWRSASLPPLPEWLSISRLVESGDALYYHSALLVAFNTTPPAPAAAAAPSTRSARSNMHNGWTTTTTSSDSSDAAECLVYTPHGITAAALEPVAAASPPLSTLAFLHGLHDVRIGWARQQLNLGGHNGLRSQRLLRARYWVGTHDEVKRGSGLIGWFLRRKVVGLEEALREERRGLWREGGGRFLTDDENYEEVWGDVRFEEVANGESRVLR